MRIPGAIGLFLIVIGGGCGKQEHGTPSTGGEITARLTIPDHSGPVEIVAFKPDGKQILSGSEKSIVLWDGQTGKKIRETASKAMAFSPDGKLLLRHSVLSAHHIEIYDIEKEDVQLTLKGHKDAVQHVLFCPDGKRIGSSAFSFADIPAEVKLWDAKTGKELISIKLKSIGLSCLAFSFDGDRIAGCERLGGDLIVWDTQSGAEKLIIKGYDGVGKCIAFSPDGNRIALATNSLVNGSKIRVWDTTSGKEMMALGGPTGSDACCVIFSPDGRRIASGYTNHEVKLHDAQTGKVLLTLKGHSSTVGYVAFSPDNKQIVSCSSQPDKTGEIKVWDVESAN